MGMIQRSTWRVRSVRTQDFLAKLMDREEDPRASCGASPRGQPDDGRSIDDAESGAPSTSSPRNASSKSP